MIKNGNVERTRGSGRPEIDTTVQHIKTAEELILSQEHQPGTYVSQRKIGNTINISQPSQSRISRNVLGFSACKKKNVENLNFSDDRLLVAKFPFP